MGDFGGSNEDTENEYFVAQAELQRETQANRAEITRQTQVLNEERFRVLKQQGAQRWNPDPFSSRPKVPEKSPIPPIVRETGTNKEGKGISKAIGNMKWNGHLG